MSFSINVVVKICKTLSKLYPSTLRKGNIEEMTPNKQIKNLTLARTLTNVLSFSSADVLASKLRVPVAEPEFLSL